VVNKITPKKEPALMHDGCVQQRYTDDGQDREAHGVLDSRMIRVCP